MNFTDDLQQGLSPYRQKVNEVLRFLLEFLKNPVHGMRFPPNWDWQVLLIFNAAAAALCGVISGIASLHPLQVVAGLIVVPILTTFGVAVITGFFYYTFMFIFKTEVSPKKVATIVILAILPYLIIYPLVQFLRPLVVFGIGATCILLVVGFTENTGVERKKIVRLVGGIFSVFLIFWVVTTINESREKKSIKDMTTPGSLDILEKEMRGE
jgi:hypothetical protein